MNIDSRWSDTFKHLDGLALVPATLEARIRKRTYDKLAKSLRCNVEREGDRLHFIAPFTSRTVLQARPKDFPLQAIAAAIHHVGGALTSQSSTLAQVPINRLPSRIAPIFWDSFPHPDELATADAIELQMLASTDAEIRYAGTSRLPLWPLDIADVGRLAKKISAIQTLGKDQIPVGVAIPRGTTNVDIRYLAKSGVDFVTLVEPSSSASTDDGLPLVWQTMAARRAAVEAGRPNLPIFMELPIRNGVDVAKWIALGASGIVLDGFLHPYLEPEKEPEEPEEGGLFSGMGLAITPSSKATNAKFIATSLQNLGKQLSEALIRCDCEQLSLLKSKHLVATNSESHRLTGIPLLG